ncbi:hypothetical protein ABFS82_05G113900 [Erythranthe guttata]|uniref:Uncharacterized protein n=1 Tax=Erythranthe guttata TaxID=4155 RepID=A0A022QNA3_ERYGU|nr:PREDICTED: uncharacterized protein LOC105967141 [Erythranthe guttata]EYU29069.1 hypothetical protein MIMGU_mgv1a015313mg [Erythranthe guttata]|eukprot:XP_012847173.1 PREDICTED: uncharacterized protein LOC105967141 [Erythranthe guttata]
MVGIFSRFSVRGSHRRTQSAIDERETLPPTSDSTNTSTTTTTAIAAPATHGNEIAVEFKPVEYPTEPLDFDQPIQCPLPEPSILNDGRIWKERVSSGAQRRPADSTVVMQAEEQTPVVEPQTPRTKARAQNRVILPSVSAPEHNILKLLEEVNASGVSFNT